MPRHNNQVMIGDLWKFYINPSNPEAYALLMISEIEQIVVNQSNTGSSITDTVVVAKILKDFTNNIKVENQLTGSSLIRNGKLVLRPNKSEINRYFLDKKIEIEIEKERRRNGK